MHKGKNSGATGVAPGSSNRRPLSWSRASRDVRGGHPEDWLEVERTFLELGNKALAARARDCFTAWSLHAQQKAADRALSEFTRRARSADELIAFAAALQARPGSERAVGAALAHAAHLRTRQAYREHTRKWHTVTLSFTDTEWEIIERAHRAARKSQGHWIRSQFLSLAALAAVFALEQTQWFQQLAEKGEWSMFEFTPRPRTAKDPGVCGETYAIHQAERELIRVDVAAEFEGKVASAGDVTRQANA